MRSLPLVLASLLVALLLGAGLRPSPAAAATPCWRSVIADWSADGSIGGSYSAVCYRQAMQNAPTDLKIYSSLEDDLQSALQSRSARRLAGVHAPVAGLDDQADSSSLGLLVALIAGVGVLLAACSAVAVAVRRRAAR